MLLDQVPSDFHHRVKRTLQDLLSPIADQLACCLRHFLFVRLDQLSQLGLEIKTTKRDMDKLGPVSTRQSRMEQNSLVQVGLVKPNPVYISTADLALFGWQRVIAVPAR